MKKNNNPLMDFPEKTEVYRALENGKVVFEHPCRAIVTGFITLNNLIGRPVSAIVPFNSIYKPSEVRGELVML